MQRSPISGSESIVNMFVSVARRDLTPFYFSMKLSEPFSIGQAAKLAVERSKWEMTGSASNLED